MKFIPKEMGVQGFGSCFFELCQGQPIPRATPQKNVLLIDGGFLTFFTARALCDHLGPRALLGLHCRMFNEGVDRIIQMVREYGYTPLVFFDGYCATTKKSVVTQRRVKALTDMHQCMQAVMRGEKPESATLVQSMGMTIDLIYSHPDIRVFQCGSEADSCMVHYARTHPEVAGIMGIDTDFIFMDVPLFYVQRTLAASQLFQTSTPFATFVSLYAPLDVMRTFFVRQPSFTLTQWRLFLADFASLCATDFITYQHSRDLRLALCESNKRNAKMQWESARRLTREHRHESWKNKFQPAVMLILQAFLAKLTIDEQVANKVPAQTLEAFRASESHYLVREPAGYQEMSARRVVLGSEHQSTGLPLILPDILPEEGYDAPLFTQCGACHLTDRLSLGFRNITPTEECFGMTYNYKALHDLRQGEMEREPAIFAYRPVISQSFSVPLTQIQSYPLETQFLTMLTPISWTADQLLKFASEQQDLMEMTPIKRVQATIARGVQCVLDSTTLAERLNVSKEQYGATFLHALTQPSELAVERYTSKLFLHASAAQILLLVMMRAAYHCTSVGFYQQLCDVLRGVDLSSLAIACCGSAANESTEIDPRQIK